jgi:formylglycine-generating enzyme required for sulfatase activity
MPELTLKRTRQTAEGFTESLGDSLGLDMMLIPGDTFLMGSPDEEPERYDDEGPQHEVTVTSFCMGRTPVTQAQWRFVAELPLVETKLEPDPANFKGDNRPVEQVTWHEAVEFCQRLAIYSGRDYRLPSEAEWEYACRAGTTTPFHFGATISPDLATYDASQAYGGGPVGKAAEGTTPVGSAGVANAFGLYDMHGNVWEWCQDVWHDNYEGAPTDGSAWMEGGNQEGRVVRGGSWLSFPRDCRSACRFLSSLGVRSSDLGFRVVCSAPRTQK